MENDIDGPFVAQIPERCAHVYDGMVIIQQLSSINLETFGEMSEYILSCFFNNQGDHRFCYRSVQRGFTQKCQTEAKITGWQYLCPIDKKGAEEAEAVQEIFKR